jgi:4-hydroxy-tetrahydrodipicolinate synthase
MNLGTILTAIVTPFDAHGAVNEESFVALMRHLAANGSDGFVVAGTTGEASTLTEREQLRLIELAVAERPPGKTIVAGTGTNDTRQAVHLTEEATALGVDATLSVTPYYNKPSRLGLLRHYEAVAAATDKPVILYNIPGRTATNMPVDFLAELAQIDGIEGVKQANAAELQLIDGLEIYAGDAARFARPLDLGGGGGHLRGEPPGGKRDAADGGRASAPRGDRLLAARRLRDVVHDREPDVHEGGPEPARTRCGRAAPAARRGHRGGDSGGARDARTPRPA